jgi:hypothetical protein
VLSQVAQRRDRFGLTRHGHPGDRGASEDSRELLLSQVSVAPARSGFGPLSTSGLEEKLKRARIAARQVTHREGNGAASTIFRRIDLAFDFPSLELDESHVCLWRAADSECHHDILVVLCLTGVSQHLDQALYACRRQLARLGVRQTLNEVRTDQFLREVHLPELRARGVCPGQQEAH